MICLNCKKQMPDDAPNCPNCGAPVIPQVQLGHEVKLRRWQRWFFYGVFILIFVASLIFALVVFAQNTSLINQLNEINSSLAQTKTDLDSAKSDLTNKDAQIQQSQSQLNQLQQELTQKTTQLQDTSSKNQTMTAEYENVKAVISAVNANTFNTLIQMGVGISLVDLSKIPVADYNLGSGNDADGDGLSDLAEIAFGTDINKADTDGDGYNDKQEIVNGYNPLGEGKYPVDTRFANAQKGKILLSVQGTNEAWYVSPKDGKRYFLGRPEEAVKALEGLNKAKSPTPVETGSQIQAQPTQPASDIIR